MNANKYLAPLDVSKEIEKISIFYNACFSNQRWCSPDLKNLEVPKNDQSFKKLEFAFSSMTLKELREAYFEYFKGEPMPFYWPAYEEYSYCDDIKRGTIPVRSANNYLFLHKGGIPPDVPEEISKIKLSRITVMTPKEAMIAEFRHRFETGYSYDEYHITRVMALSSVESPKIRYVETTKGFVDSQFPEHAKERLAGVYLFNTNKLNEFRLSMTTSHCDSCNGFHDPKVMCPNRIFSQAKRVFGYREIVLASF